MRARNGPHTQATSGLSTWAKHKPVSLRPEGQPAAAAALFVAVADVHLPGPDAEREARRQDVGHVVPALADAGPGRHVAVSADRVP